MAYATSVNLVSVRCAYFSNSSKFARSLYLAGANIGASGLGELRRFVHRFRRNKRSVSNRRLRGLLSRVRRVRKLCSPVTLKVTTTLTYNKFAFLLNNKLVRVLYTFINTKVKGFVEYGLDGRRFALFLYVTSSISTTYLICTKLLGTTRVL